MKEHKHSDLIVAWARGADIQVRVNFEWYDDPKPCWNNDVEYRIKPTPPAKQYPKTLMSLGELSQAMPFRTGDLQDVANAALRHAIDNGQVAPLDAYQQCAADLLKAEEKIRGLIEEAEMFNRDLEALIVKYAQ